MYARRYGGALARLGGADFRRSQKTGLDDQAWTFPSVSVFCTSDGTLKRGIADLQRSYVGVERREGSLLR